jgi:hypothetical protein
MSMLEVALARLPQLVGTFRVVGVYLRETKRRNRDGSTVAYLQLAHSERHPVTGVPSAKVIHGTVKLVSGAAEADYRSRYATGGT